MEADLKGSRAYDFLKLGDKSDDIENKIQRIIEYVQNQIIYLYDAEVMHGHIPQSSLKTLELKSGDCKAKSLLLINLLASIDVKSDFVLINYTQDYHIPNNLPSPFLFNHAIVRLSHKGKEYFVDPTWSDRCGELDKRSEPFFAHFLVVRKNSNIESRKERTATDINLEQKIDIRLKGEEGFIKRESILRRETADAVRSAFRKQDKTQLIQNQNKDILSNFSYSQERDPSTLFKDTRYRTFTKSLIRKLLIARKHLKIDSSPISIRIFEITEGLEWGLKKLEVAHQRKVSKVLSS